MPLTSYGQPWLSVTLYCISVGSNLITSFASMFVDTLGSSSFIILFISEIFLCFAFSNTATKTSLILSVLL
ncbi:hypothetical protein D3C72_1173190 [compost metagenome]